MTTATTTTTDRPEGARRPPRGATANPIRYSRRLTAAIAAATALFAVAPAVHAGPAGPDVPAEIEVPAGNKVFLVGHAVGVQIYTCNATVDGHRWGFVAPEANLYGANGNLVATHFGGPTWKAGDGSTVVARLDHGVTVDATAIPWLRLSAVSTSHRGKLAQTTFIQRTATTGGLTPAAAGCNATTVGTTAEVPYTADYHFWK
ncbi:MAG: DUF3455 domain-containing protein, partial [Ilumatobacteraceae bacterium]